MPRPGAMRMLLLAAALALTPACDEQLPGLLDGSGGGGDGPLVPDYGIEDAQIMTLEGGKPAYKVPPHALVARNARAPSLASDSKGGLHLAYLCNCKGKASGNSATMPCDRICYAKADCAGLRTVVGPQHGIGGDTYWGTIIGVHLALDEKDRVFVLKNLRNKQDQHPKVSPNSVHLYDPKAGAFSTLDQTFDAMAILPRGGLVYMVGKRERQAGGDNGILLKVVDTAGKVLRKSTLLATAGADTALFVGGVALDPAGRLNIVYRVDDSTPPKHYDMKNLVYDPKTHKVLREESVTGERIGDHHGIAAGGDKGDLLAAAAPAAWSAGIRLATRRGSAQSWTRRLLLTNEPRVTWNSHDSEGVDYLNPEPAVDRLGRVFVALGGVSNEEVLAGKSKVYSRCWYKGPCDCKVKPDRCFYGINAYYFVLHPNGAVGPLQLLRPGSTVQNYQGHGEQSAELAAAWDRGVFAAYEHLDKYDGTFSVHLTPLGGAVTACGRPVIK